MPRRVQLLRLFLWLSVLSWGVMLGAKLFDLRVLAGAWNAAPPHSLSLLPYGPRFPVDPGAFFLPVSPTTLVAAIGAVIAGRNTPSGYRLWLWLSASLILLVFLVTLIVMWPMNAALYAASREASVANPAEVIRKAHRWVAYDWLRVKRSSFGGTNTPCLPLV